MTRAIVFDEAERTVTFPIRKRDLAGVLQAVKAGGSLSWSYSIEAGKTRRKPQRRSRRKEYWVD